MTNQTCIVTGANGFIGKRLCASLRAQQISVRACTRKAQNKFDYETGDLTSFSNWTHLFEGAETLIHLAAKVHDMRNSSNDEYMQLNTELTIKLARQAKLHGIKRFIFISSIKVNGEFTTNTPFKAEDSPKPLDFYATSKHLAETELLNLHEKNVFEVVIIRPCLVYGKGVKANFANLTKLVQKSYPLPFASTKNQRSLVSIDNLIDFINVCKNHPLASGQVFLVSDGKDLSLAELVYEIKQAVHSRTLLIPFPVSIFKVFLNVIGKNNLFHRLFGNLQVDIQKNKDLLGWTPPYSIQFSLQYLKTKD